MRFVSLFAGVGGFDLALHNAGWQCAAQVEIEANCRAVLHRHWPDVPQFTNVTEFGRNDVNGSVQLVCGGSPCQAFSVAGLRKSLDDARGNLAFEFVRVCDELNPEWVFWENVPGVLNTSDNAFGCFLAGLVGEDAPLLPCGGRWTNAGLVVGPRRRAAWRICDAQYFGVAQRRRRVFVVASAGEICPSQILFERKGSGGNTSTRGETRTEIARAPIQSVAINGNSAGGIANAITASAGHHGHSSPRGDGSDNLVVNCFNGYTGGADDNDAQANHIVAFSSKDDGRDASQEISPTLRSMSHDKTHMNGGGQVAVAFRTSGNCGVTDQGDKTAALNTATDPCQNIVQIAPVIAFTERTRSDGRAIESQEELSYALTNPGNGGRTQERNVAGTFGVRRLTPVETCRLQGFPDNWNEYGIDETGKRIEMSDSTRYRQMGNAVAVPCVEWIARRIPLIGDGHHEK